MLTVFVHQDFLSFELKVLCLGSPISLFGIIAQAFLFPLLFSLFQGTGIVRKDVVHLTCASEEEPGSLDPCKILWILSTYSYPVLGVALEKEQGGLGSWTAWFLLWGPPL